MRTIEISFAGGVPIDGYAPGAFRVAGAVHRGPLAMLPGGAAPWAGLPEIRLFLDQIADLDLVLIGAGAEFGLPGTELVSARAELEAAGVGVEIMSTGAACRTYNVLLSEGRRIAAALMPV
jgi:uncharacterized protein